MNLTIFQKIILALILISLFSGLVPFFPFTKAKVANAVLPVVDVDAIFQLSAINVSLGVIDTATADTAVNTSGHLAETLLEWGKKIAVQLIKKTLLNRLVDKIIDWIQGGNFKGRVVDDWKAFLRQAGNEAVGGLAQELGAGFLCSPFNFQIQILLAQPQRFSQQATCTLDDIVGNIQNFYDDFRNGGWIAYQESWLPQNNFYGATILALDEATNREAEAKEAARNEAVAGGGFLSSKQCDDKGNCRILTPGSILGDAATKILVDTPLNTILSAQDIDAYATAIADAAVNRLTKNAIDKLLGR